MRCVIDVQVGNAAEHVTSVWMACKGKMELTIGVAVGSSIQIAAGMIPLLVIIAWPMNKDLTLDFTTFETIVLFVSVMLVNLLLQDGAYFRFRLFNLADRVFPPLSSSSYTSRPVSHAYLTAVQLLTRLLTARITSKVFSVSSNLSDPADSQSSSFTSLSLLPTSCRRARPRDDTNPYAKLSFLRYASNELSLAASMAGCPAYPFRVADAEHLLRASLNECARVRVLHLHSNRVCVARCDSRRATSLDSFGKHDGLGPAGAGTPALGEE